MNYGQQYVGYPPGQPTYQVPPQYPGGSSGYPGPPPQIPPPYVPYNQQYLAQPQMFQQPQPPMDTDSDDKFDTTYVRHAFIRKVYTILSIQLIITFGMVVLCVYCAPVKAWILMHPILMIIGLIGSIALLLPIMCCASVRLRFPINIILLMAYTVCMGITLSFFACLKNRPTEVMMAIGITAAVCFTLTIYAFQTKYDFTTCGGLVMVLCIVLLIFGIVNIFVRSNILRLVYGAAAALIYSFFLVFDTQMMMGGNHSYSISPEEYVLAALHLYIDVIQIFYSLLLLLSGDC